MTIEVVNFGCRLNAYESELIKKHAADAGLNNTVIFNSCAVTSEAERQLRQSIRKIHREKPNSKVIVTGCAAQINPKKYADMPEVSLVIGNIEKLDPKSYQNFSYDDEKILVNDIMSVQETAFHLIESLEGKVRGFLQIQNGCNHRCTFCIIPYGRGNNRSVAIGEIVNQARILVNNGYKELVLTGVDITDYGLNLPGKPRLAQMIKRLLAQIPDLPRLRLSSVDIAEVDQELIDLIANEPRLLPHLHLSLQSGDDMILKRMKRRHTSMQVKEFCNNMKILRPEIVFGADIITGFPTENDDMFNNTVKLVQELEICHLHVFPYSEREGTPAARMPQVLKNIRKERAAILRDIGKEALHKHYINQIGKKLEVLVESSHIGRTADFSLTKFSDNEEDIPIGKIIQCDIIEAADDFLTAKII